MSAVTEEIALLRSIDATLKALLAARKIAPAVADAADLDSKYGDPLVHFTPRDYTGPSMKGLRMSQCEPDGLIQLASAFDYFAEKADAENELYKGKPVAPYKRKDAARARGWAARLRAGWKRQDTLDEAPPF